MELVRSQYNGLTIATDDPHALARAMRWAEQNHARLSELGQHGMPLAEAFTAASWGEKWATAFAELFAKGGEG